MWTNKVQKQLEATIEFKVDDVVDLNMDILWTTKEMEDEANSNDVKQEGELVQNLCGLCCFMRE